MAAERHVWRTAQSDLDASRLVFVDETGASTKMARRCGRSRRGERCVAAVPHGHWKTTTFVGGLRLSGIAAPMTIDSAMDGPAFLAWVERMLVPALRPGDIVVMDNLGSHKSKAVRNAIRSVGARCLFLPAYSPDLNPIEQVFAKLKALLRRLRPRTIEANWRSIGKLLPCFSPRECANYFRNAGYASA